MYVDDDYRNEWDKFKPSLSSTLAFLRGRELLKNKRRRHKKMTKTELKKRMEIANLEIVKKKLEEGSNPCSIAKSLNLDIKQVRRTKESSIH